MKTNSLINNVSKAFLLSGIMVFSSSCLNAWTISVLTPETTIAEYSSYDGSTYQTFRGYLTGAGSSLTAGSLSSYAIGSSDAVIVNVLESNHEYTSTELSVLTSLLNNNTRVLMFSENSLWNLSNDQLAGILVGINSGSDGADSQTVINSYPLITEGVSNVRFFNPGKISPNGGNGMSLFSGDGMSLWGTNENFLLSMDVNIFQDGTYINMPGTGNDQLARNVANWLGGVDLAPVPEPSSYALLMGLAGLGVLVVRRRR